MLRIVKLTACLITLSAFSTAAHVGNSSPQVNILTKPQETISFNNGVTASPSITAEKTRRRIIRRAVTKTVEPLPAMRSDRTIIFNHNTNAKTKLVKPEKQVKMNMPNLFRN